MCGGLSSRLKNTLAESAHSPEIKQLGQKYHKSLLPIGKMQHPLLYYCLKNAQKAAVTSVSIVTAEETEGFEMFLDKYAHHPFVSSLAIELIPQRIPLGRTKPLGTADAVLQAIEHKQKNHNQSFVVINGDNLYSANALKALFQLPEKQQALIGYQRNALRYPTKRLQQFSILECDTKNYLKRIVEKPSTAEVERLNKTQKGILVSMNAFKFYGPSIYPYLKNCPIDPLRNEKELPKAVQNQIEQDPKSFIVLPLKEHVPDLTAIDDLTALIESVD